MKSLTLSLVCILLAIPATSHATLILWNDVTILSKEFRVSGNTHTSDYGPIISYDLPVSGDCGGGTLEQAWSTAGHAEGSEAGISSPEHLGVWAEASSTYVYTPHHTGQLRIDITGETDYRGFMMPGLSFHLIDKTLSQTIYSQQWYHLNPYETHSFYHDAVLGNEYEIELWAAAGNFDVSYMTNHIWLVPEPATLLLLGLGAVIVRKNAKKLDFLRQI